MHLEGLRWVEGELLLTDVVPAMDAMNLLNRECELVSLAEGERVTVASEISVGAIDLMIYVGYSDRRSRDGDA